MTDATPLERYRAAYASTLAGLRRADARNPQATAHLAGLRAIAGPGVGTDRELIAVYKEGKAAGGSHEAGIAELAKEIEIDDTPHDGLDPIADDDGLPIADDNPTPHTPDEG